MRALILPALLLSFLTACSPSFDPNECRPPRYLAGYEMRYEKPVIASRALAHQLRSQMGIVCTYTGVSVTDTSFGQRYRFIRVPTGETIWTFDPNTLLRSGEYPYGSDCVCVNDSTFLLSCSLKKNMRYFFIVPSSRRVQEVQFAGIAGRAWTNDRSGIVEDPLITIPDGRQCMLVENGSLLVDLEIGQIVDSVFKVAGPGQYYQSSSEDGKRMLTSTPRSSGNDQVFLNDVRIDGILSVTSHDNVVLRSDGMQLASIRYMNVAANDGETDDHIFIERWDCSDLGSIRRIASVDVTAATCRYSWGMPIAIAPDGSVISTGFRTADLSAYDVFIVSATDGSVRVVR